jgi:hypothetical protein
MGGNFTGGVTGTDSSGDSTGGVLAEGLSGEGLPG